MREVAAETAVEETRSPRISWTNGSEAGDLQQYAEDLAAGVTSSLAGSNSNGNSDDMAARGQQDDLNSTQNGAAGSQDDAEDGDMDIDDGDLSDDMMDKISSSPSIDDGGFTCQPSAISILQQVAAPCSSQAPMSLSEARSFPYLGLHDYLSHQSVPLQHASSIAARGTPTLHHHHHLPSAFPEDVQEPLDSNVSVRDAEWWNRIEILSRDDSHDFYGDISTIVENMKVQVTTTSQPV